MNEGMGDLGAEAKGGGAAGEGIDQNKVEKRSLLLRLPHLDSKLMLIANSRRCHNAQLVHLFAFVLFHSHSNQLAFASFFSITGCQLRSSSQGT